MPKGFPVERTAVLVIDLQKENLEEGAWPVEGYAEVLANSAKAIEACRKAGLPIIYTRHWLDPRGIDAMRYEPREADGRPVHSVAGDPKGEICAEVAPDAADIIIDKQKFTAFYGTKLDVVLSNLDVNHLIMLGVWTEACLETSVWDALWRDYRITLIKDACGSSTSTMHRAAILDMANWLIGGRIMRTDQLVTALEGKTYTSWEFEKGNALPYTLETLNELYESLG